MQIQAGIIMGSDSDLTVMQAIYEAARSQKTVML